MPTPLPPTPAQLLRDEVIRLVPSFLEDPIDFNMSAGHGAFIAIGPDGQIHGYVFGPDKSRSRFSLGIAHRKVSQVWATGYATGEFEKLVYGGELDEGKFGVNKPDFIGWEGGIPLWAADGSMVAAGFSGFRGIKDIEIITRAAAHVPGLRVQRR